VYENAPSAALSSEKVYANQAFEENAYEASDIKDIQTQKEVKVWF